MIKSIKIMILRFLIRDALEVKECVELLSSLTYVNKRYIELINCSDINKEDVETIKRYKANLEELGHTLGFEYDDVSGRFYV